MKLAVDIVLLPSARIVEKAIAANAELLKRYPSSYVLNKKDRFAHISLCMGTLDQKDVQRAAAILQEIVRRLQPLELTITRTNYYTAEGNVTSGWEIARSAELRRLHEEIVAKFKPLLLPAPGDEPVWYDARVSEHSREFMRAYIDSHAFANFNPHITLGFGEAKSVDAPIGFTASQLTLCQMGDFNSCRKILFETTLGAGQK